MSEYHKKYKTFKAAFVVFHKDPVSFKKIFKDKRPTNLEKKLLKVLELIKHTKTNEALMTLESMNPSCIFLKGIKLFLEGFCHLGGTNALKAVQFLSESIQCFESVDEEYFIFYPEYCLALCYGNLNDIPKMKVLITKLEKHKPQNLWQEVTLLRTISYYYAQSGKYKKALKIINEAFEYQGGEFEIQMLSLITVKFIILFKLEDYNQCRELLVDYKKYRSYRVSCNFKYMKGLLDNYLDDTSIYLYDSDFIDNPDLLEEANVIRYLNSGEMDLAQTYWSLLMKRNPNVYLKDFQFAGDRCLFSACLKKNYKASQCLNSSTIDFDNLKGSVEEKLLYILEHSSKPLSKIDLVQHLWGVEMDAKSSSRFNVLLSRVKKKHEISVKANKGSYVLIKKAA
jgi:tetratricopeptide (TPR) repeat protein